MVTQASREDADVDSSGVMEGEGGVVQEGRKECKVSRVGSAEEECVGVVAGAVNGNVCVGEAVKEFLSDEHDKFVVWDVREVHGGELEVWDGGEIGECGSS